MAPLPAIENRVLTALYAAVSAIGSPSSDWLTIAPVVLGVPGDAVTLASLGGNPRIYIHHLGTDLAAGDGSMGLRTHSWRVRIGFWIVAPTQTALLNAKADVARAVFKAEGTLTSAFKQPLYVESFSPRDDFNAVGISSGVLSCFMDLDVPHDAP